MKGLVVRRAALVVGLLALLAAGRAEAQIIKLATLAPEGSSWHNILKETAAQWKTISGGKVTLRIYAGGTQGDDPDVVRKMKLGVLNAGVLTAVGVAEIDNSVYALGVPLMFDSDEEVYAVLEKMRPRLEASIEKQGFVVLNWADAGWVHFFTQKPVATPDDLKALKLFTWQGDEKAVSAWKAAGFNPVPLPATEIATALQTGLVTALGTPPQVAVISQYYNQAKNMTDLKWQLLLGASVITKKTWEQIPAEIRPALKQAAEDAGKKMRAEVVSSLAKDVEAMKKRGLNVVAVDARNRAAWQKAAEAMYPQVRGPIVPADAFDEALRLRDEYRRTRNAKGGK
jgi:TRAP-type C4-dicarboxylate transport system substrate-binding protein